MFVRVKQKKCSLIIFYYDFVVVVVVVAVVVAVVACYLFNTTQMSLSVIDEAIIVLLSVISH